MITAAAPPLTAPIAKGHMSMLERTAYVALLGFAAAPQFSIAVSTIFLGIAAVLWLTLVIVNHERIEVPDMFWPLAVYAGATIVSAASSPLPSISLLDCKQLLLFAIVPMAYRLFQGARTLKVVDVIITVGALNAVYGIVQYSFLKHDTIETRIQGNLGHYMTYSGVIMMVACIAFARVMFRRRDRLWAALVLPSVMVALVLTLSRNAWVGACAGIGTLFLLKDIRHALRFAAVLPIALALVVGFAPASVTDRLASMVSLNDKFKQSEEGMMSNASNRDRLAMAKMGVLIVRDYPLTGVGPDMVKEFYPTYRSKVSGAVSQVNSHLHNVPLQIAAERGLPALAIWLWFVVTLLRDFLKKRKTSSLPSLATAGIACVVAMLAAGMFEYNFGDSEFLMLFLVVITLPYAADRHPPAALAGANRGV